MATDRGTLIEQIMRDCQGITFVDSRGRPGKYGFALPGVEELGWTDRAAAKRACVARIQSDAEADLRSLGRNTCDHGPNAACDNICAAQGHLTLLIGRCQRALSGED